MTSSCSWGIPPLLNSLASNFLAAGAGPSQQGGPTLSASMVVLSFVSTFAMPARLSSVCSTSIYSLMNSATCDVAVRSAVLAMDQLFIVGPGFSPVPAKLHAQIVAGKYIDLNDLLAVNLVQKELELQLVRWSTCADFPAEKTTITHQRHHFMDGGLCHFFPYSGLLLS